MHREAPINPYAAPQAPVGPDLAGLDPLASVQVDSLLARWERLRVAYNLILLLEVLTLSASKVRSPGGLGDDLADGNFWALCLGGAFMANIGYCVGVVGNAYLAWIFRLRGRPTTFVLFGLGLLVALFITASCLIEGVQGFP